MRRAAGGGAADGGWALNVPNDGGPDVCSRCGEGALLRQGNQLLCPKHYRFGQMRQRARRDGKVVPTWAELETMFAALVDMACPLCSRKMNWRRAAGESTCATLQHYRDGTLDIICLACNTRHAQHPGDTYRELPPDAKHCPDCSRVLPRSSFATDRSRPIGLKSYCRGCSAARHAKWRSRHAVA